MKPNAQRVALRYLQSRPYQYNMGAWGGQDYKWPDPKDWDVTDFKMDRFRDAYRLTYQYVGRSGDYLHLFVSFDASAFINSSGQRPGTLQADAGGGQVKKDTWRSIADIERALRDAVKWAQGLRDAMKRQIENLGGSTWEVSFDGYQITAWYRGKKSSRYSDAHMDVSFLDVEDALVAGDSSRATISFAEGSDYGGHYGEKEVERTYSNIRDISRILDEAAKLFAKWDPPRPDLQD